MLKHSLFWVMFIDEPTDNGGGQGETVSSEPQSTTEPSGTESYQSQSEPSDNGGSESTGINPNWNGLLEVLPDSYLKGKVQPFLEEFDRNNNKRFEKVQQQFAPYQELVDNQIPYEDVRTAFMLRNEIQQNPQVIFEKLAQHLGYDISKLSGNAGDPNSQGLPNQTDESELEDLDPRVRQAMQQTELLKRQQEAMLQMMTLDKQREVEAQQQQQERQWYSETVQTLDKLGVPKEGDERNRFVQFALMEQQRTGARDVDFRSSWDAYRAWRGPQANATAPDVTAGNGNFAAEKYDFSKMSNDDVENLAIQKLRQLNGK